MSLERRAAALQHRCSRCFIFPCDALVHLIDKRIHIEGRASCKLRRKENVDIYCGRHLTLYKEIKCTASVAEEALFIFSQLATFLLLPASHFSVTSFLPLSLSLSRCTPQTTCLYHALLSFSILLFSLFHKRPLFFSVRCSSNKPLSFSPSNDRWVDV